MKKFIYLMCLLVSFCPAAYAGSSASYSVTVEVFGGGGGDASSATHAIHGKTRAAAYGIRNSTSFRVGEGFMNASFNALSLLPLISSISPSSAKNTAPASVVISGSNFSSTPETTLTMAGQPDITGESISVPDSGHINCVFNITGKQTGAWNVVVVNSDGGVGTLESGFAVTSGGGGKLKVVGRPINFPNPFDPDKRPTTIKYVLTRDASITLNIYNINGERIWQEKYPSGSTGGKEGVNEVLWDGYTVFSQIVPNGIYVFQISSGGNTLATGKIAVFR